MGSSVCIFLPENIRRLSMYCQMEPTLLKTTNDDFHGEIRLSISKKIFETVTFYSNGPAGPIILNFGDKSRLYKYFFVQYRGKIT